MSNDKGREKKRGEEQRMYLSFQESSQLSGEMGEAGIWYSGGGI